MGRVIAVKFVLLAFLLALTAWATPSSASSALPVECQLGPFTSGGDTVCHGDVAGVCSMHAHIYDVEDALNQYDVDCLCAGVHLGGGPPLKFECLATQSASAEPGVPCQTGIAQTWCDATVGPCDVRVTPWTAWGDVYAWADCRFSSMTRCYAEVHTQDPLNPEQWCAF